MYKFVLDADATIKLAKAGVLEDFAAFAECLIPKQVYDEIIKGKEKNREDAFAIDKLVSDKKLKVVNAEIEGIQENLGAGEKAALATFKTHKAEAIASDDKKFLNKLEAGGVPFTTTANLIVALVTNKKLTKDRGLRALNKIKNSIKADVYNKAKEALGGDETWQQ